MFLLLCGVSFAAPLSPDDAVVAALTSHPTIAAAEAALTSAAGSARQSALLRENPDVDVDYGLVGDRLGASISQPLSVTGEGLADHKSARARLAATEAGLDRARLEVAAGTRSAYVEAVVAHNNAVLAQAAFDLASRQIAGASERLRVGEASDLDLRLSRLEQARAAQELLAARSLEAVSLARLSTLVRAPIDGNDLALDPLRAVPTGILRPVADRSDVRAARLAVDAAEAEVSRERAAALPPVRLGAFYEADGGSVIAGPSLGLTLPLWHQNQAGVAEARGTAMVRRAEFAAVAALADAEVRTAALAERAATTTMSTVPATNDDALAALASIEAGVRSGELDLVTTLLLRAEIVAGQRALVAARGDLALARITVLLATEDASLLGGVSP